MDKTERMEEFYRDLASTKKYATSLDIHLREIEIETISSYLEDGKKILDMGCGNGYSTIRYARDFDSDFTGMDFTSKMVECARKMETGELKGRIEFKRGDICNIPLPDESFDIVTTSRVVIALPHEDWEVQKKAIGEMHRVLMRGGEYLMMESSEQGLQRLNDIREMFGLYRIPTNPKWSDLKFDEEKLVPYLEDLFDIIEVKRFGMYYFIGRVIHPLLVAPEEPKYDNPINRVACEIARKIPNFRDIGALVFYHLKKK